MDSFSIKITLKPWKNHVPTFWSNFVDDLAKINNLRERLAALQNMKLWLKKEATRLSTSGLEPFTMSMGFLKDAIKYLEEEEESIIKDMGKFQKLSAFTDMSQNLVKAKDAGLGGRCLARKKTDNGISSRVKVRKVESNAFGNSSSLYNQHLQMVEKALHRHKQMMMENGKEKSNGLSFSSTVKGTRGKVSSSRSSDSVYSQHLQMIQKALSRYKASMGPN